MSRPLPFLRLRCPLETTKPVRHELAEERVQLCKSLGTDAVKTPRAFSALAHQSALLEHLQMLRDGRLGDGKARSDAPGAQLTGGKQPHDLASPRLCDGLEDLHRYSLAWPYISKRYSAGTRLDRSLLALRRDPKLPTYRSWLQSNFRALTRDAEAR